MLRRGYFPGDLNLVEFKLIEPAREGEGATFLEFNVTADDEFLFGAGGGNVEQAVIFGFGAVVFEAGGELPGGGVEVLVAQVEEQRVGELDFVGVAAMLVSRVGEDGEGKLEPFGFVDGHELDGASG